VGQQDLALRGTLGLVVIFVSFVVIHEFMRIRFPRLRERAADTISWIAALIVGMVMALLIYPHMASWPR